MDDICDVQRVSRLSIVDLKPSTASHSPSLKVARPVLLETPIPHSRPFDRFHDATRSTGSCVRHVMESAADYFRKPPAGMTFHGRLYTAGSTDAMPRSGRFRRKVPSAPPALLPSPAAG